MQTRFNGTFTAYCPEIDDERSIRLEIVKEQGLGNFVDYSVTSFQCSDFYDCQFAKQNGECEFTDEVISQLICRKNNF